MTEERKGVYVPASIEQQTLGVLVTINSNLASLIQVVEEQTSVLLEAIRKSKHK